MAKNMKFAMVIQAIDKMTSPLRVMGKAVGDMTNKAERGLDGMADDAAKSRAKLASVVKPIGKIGKSLNRLGKNTGLDEVGKQAGRLKNSLGSVLTATSALGVGIAGAFWGMDAVAKNSAQHSALAKSVGISTSSLSAWAGMVKEGGFEADHIVDLVEEMNNKFGESKGLGATTPVKEGLQMLGLEFSKLSKLKPEEQFTSIFDAMSKAKDKQIAVSAGDMIFGGEASKIGGFIWEQAKTTGKAASAIAAEFKKINLTTKEGEAGNKAWANASFKLFYMVGSAVSELAGIFGKVLAPVVKDVMTWITNNFGTMKDTVASFATDFAAWVKDLINPTEEAKEKTKSLLGLFMDFIKWIGPGKAIVAGLAAVIAGPLLASIAAITVAFVTMGTAMWATPIGWIVAGIAAIGVAIATIYIYLDEFKAEFKAAMDFIKGICSAIADYISSFAQSFKDSFNNALQKLIEFFQSINLFTIGQNLIASLGEGIEASWSDITSWLSNSVNELIDVLPDFIKSQIGLDVTSASTPSSSASLTTPSALPDQGTSNVGGTIKVAFENAPPTMRTKEVKSDNSNVLLDVDAGYNMMAL